MQKMTREALLKQHLNNILWRARDNRKDYRISRGAMCDHGYKLDGHNYCFRRGTHEILLPDASGIMTPVIAFCEEHINCR